MLTASQLRLARHALGLPNKWNRSFRNRFVVSPGGGQYIDWILMAGDGLAVRELGGKMDCFYLTRKGAEAALLPHERLDAEDFPC